MITLSSPFLLHRTSKSTIKKNHVISLEPFYIGSIFPTKIKQVGEKNEFERIDQQIISPPMSGENQELTYEMMNMVQKRKRKMNKHKHRKRMKRDRFLRRKLKK